MGKVLIVEDEVLVGFQLKVDLTRLGYQVCELATSGEEAVSIARSENPDVLLVDMRLAGGMSGMDAVRQIRSFSSSTPVVFISGYSEETLRHQTAHLQPATYLVKPVRTADVQSAIVSLLAA